MTHPAGRVETVATERRLADLLQPGVPRHATTDGYVDTLPGQDVAPPGRAQAAWQTRPGSLLWQAIQPALASLLVPGYRTVADQLRLAPGQTVADVGCGPGNVTTGLAEAVGPHGLAVGLDLSGPMLARAATQARPNMGLVRGDASRLPLRDGCVDAACATAVVMLVPEPAHALAEMVRVVKPGGWLLLMVPARPTGPLASVTRPLSDLLGRFGGARMFTAEEVTTLLEQFGCDRIHSYQQGNMITVRARTPAGTRGAAAPEVPDTADFDALYRGDYQAFNRAGADEDAVQLDRVPWDIGEAQPVLRQLEADGQISSEVLDIGCGPGENALFLAGHGYQVCGLDAAPAAIETARGRARTREVGHAVEFGVADAITLPGYTDRFATVVDSALYHCLTEEQRHAYAAALHRACRPGARLHLMCFSDRVPADGPGPYRITEDNLRSTLPNAGWTIQHLEHSTYTTAYTRHDLTEQPTNPLLRALGATDLRYDHNDRLLAPIWLATAQRR